MTPAQPMSLLGHLRRRVARAPDRVLFTYLAVDDEPPRQVSAGELWQLASTVAAALTARELRQRPVLLLYAAGPEFAPAFFGTLLAGAVAVPVPVPQFTAQHERLERIMADCRPGAILCTSDLKAKLLAKLSAASALRHCEWLATDALCSASFDAPELAPTALALLQYTSGSTAEPKGVALTLGNLAHHIQLLAQAFAPSQGARIVSWLPHFHDMGLVTGFMAPFASNGDAVLMSPLAFLRRPLRWLQAIADYQGEISGAPNFAYDLCVKAAQRGPRPALKLSSWRSAFVGAEPIRLATLEAFAACFARDGFDRTALTPCYGMAEATLLVACKPAGTPPRAHALSRAALQRGSAQPAEAAQAVQLVGCGLPAGGTVLRIVDPERRVAVPPFRVGEAWLAGPQLARGYWSKAADDPFGATLADTGEGPFLRTGDLGFVTAEGELVFVERLKDLVIVNGQNYVSHDLELTAGGSHALLTPGGCIAVQIYGAGLAQLLIVAELAAQDLAEAEAVATAVRASIFTTHGLPVHTVVFVAPRKLSRTTSGKLQRRLTAQRLLEGTLPVLAQLGEPLPSRSSHPLQR